MSKRITDEDLSAAITMCEKGQIEAPLLRLRTSLDDDMSAALLNPLRELRARRAADLSAEDVEALTWLVKQVNAIRFMRVKEEIPDPHTHRAIAVLDKLIGGRDA